MGFRIGADEAIGDAIRRIASEQTGRALDDLDRLADGRSAEIVDDIHDVRKRCKKVRGLVRLVRPALGGRYSEINRTYRDASRELAGYRDAQAVLATFDVVVARSVDRLPPGGLGAVRDGLAERARAATRAANDGTEPIDRARDLLAGALAGIDEWRLDDRGWDAIAGGLSKTYGRGRDALASATEQPRADRYHELRKRAKYTWYHLRLLRPTAPSLLGPLAEVWHDLSDALGDAHDLAVIRDQLVDEPDAFGGRDRVEAALLLLDGHRQRLEGRSAQLAARLYAERPKHFVRRLGRYWEIRQEAGPERPVGPVAELDDVTDDLDDLTVASLRELASAVDLPGRSSLRRDDLIAALRAHGAATHASV